MDRQRILDRLRISLERKALTTVYVTFDDESNHILGYPVLLSRNFVCLAEIDDFLFDGFRVLPLRHVTKIRVGRQEAFWHRILRSEGVGPTIETPNWLSLRGYGSIFRSLQERSEVLVVDDGLEDGECAVGVVTAVERDKVILRGFDSFARWEEGTYVIPFKQISWLCFQDEYSTVLSKYVR